MIREGLAPVSYFRVFQGSPEPEFAAKPARHFTNLFEAPTIFYAGCLTAMVAGVTGVGVVALAWAYVAMRYLHTYIHLGSNRVRYRMRAYFASWLFLVVSGLMSECRGSAPLNAFATVAGGRRNIWFIALPSSHCQNRRQ